MEEMLINVFESDKNLWPKLVDKSVDLLLRKHVTEAVVFEPEAQALLDKHNFSVEWLILLKVIMSLLTRLTWRDKTNWFVTKTVDTKWYKGDKIKRTVTINYTYTQPVRNLRHLLKRFEIGLESTSKRFNSYQGYRFRRSTGGEKREIKRNISMVLSLPIGRSKV